MILKPNKLSIGIVGFGYWGPNWVRNVLMHENYELAWIVEKDQKRQQSAMDKFNLSKEKVVPNVETALMQFKPNLVLIATSPNSHLELSKLIAKEKINLIVEKPCGVNSEQMLEIINLEKKYGINLFVDHTYMFTPAANVIKDKVKSGVLGDLQFVLSSRLNLGLIQKDVDVVRDLAIHDFSLFDNFFDEFPTSLSLNSKTHFPATIDSSACVNLNYPNNFLAQVNVSWNSPVKVRNMIISGSNRSIIWDDTNQTEKVKVFEASADIDLQDPKRHISYSLGITEIPKLPVEEAIKLELDHIYECMVQNKKPLNGTEHMLRMHKILDACHKSQINNSKLIEIL